MSRTVHLLKFYNDHPEVVSAFKDKRTVYLLYSKYKAHVEMFRKFIDDFNKMNSSTPGPEHYKGLSLPRLKLLMALVAQKKGMTSGIKMLNPSKLARESFLYKAPIRFKEKFAKLLVNGFWLLGTVIEDSLCEDIEVNYNNPFSFEPGDLGFWWAGVVIMDWWKYQRSLTLSVDTLKKKTIVTVNCSDFYNDSCISRIHKYYQNSAISSLQRIPQQFLSKEDMENFSTTMKMMDTEK